MYIIQRFDAYIGIDDIDHRVPLSTDIDKYILDIAGYWEGMVDGDLPAGTTVTLNVDRPFFPSVYFLTITIPEKYAAEHDYPVHQTDVFFIIRNDDPEEADVSALGGAQCHDCGRVNVEADHRPLIVPVWRQAPDGINLLCDDCADGTNTES